jgi:hypothetical protein
MSASGISSCLQLQYAFTHKKYFQLQFKCGCGKGQVELVS